MLRDLAADEAGIAALGDNGRISFVGELQDRRLALGRSHGVPAAVLVPGCLRIAQRGLLLAAALLRVRAAGREPTAPREVDEARRAAGDGEEPAVARVLEPGDRLHQRLGVRHLHVGEEGPGRRLLDDAARVHHRGVVGAP